MKKDLLLVILVCTTTNVRFALLPKDKIKELGLVALETKLNKKSKPLTAC